MFNHLSNVLLKLAAQNPQDALLAFERHSASTKQSTFIAGAGEGTATRGQGVELAAEAASEWANGSTALYRPSSGGSAALKPLSGAVTALEWAGVGVDAEEAHRIDKALAALAEVQDAASIRFWGRVQGRNSDYFIAEALPKAYDDAKDAPDVESGPLGANRFTYYVASVIGGPENWTRLGPVTTAQLKIAPLLRRYFTGDLTAAVGGHPAFPGNEGQLLHAVITHISAATSVCPADTFVAGEGDEDADFRTQENAITDAEELAVDLEALTAPGGWSHYVPGINADGRAKNYIPRAYDAEEKADVPNPDENAADELPAIRELDEGEEDTPNWSVSGAGQQRAIKSLIWPGAVTVASETTFTNYYNGFGVPRAAPRQYVPVFPGKLSTEFGMGEVREAEDVTDKPPEPEVEEEEEDE